MKRLVVLLLVCSVALNAALASRALQRAAGVATTASRAAARQPLFAGNAVRPGLAGPAAAHDTSVELLRELEGRFLANARLAAHEYWRTGQQYEIAFGRARLNGQDRIRAELVALLGPGARSDAALRHLFRPLDPHYEFLSSAQQLAVQRLRFERDASLLSAMRNRGPSSTGLPAGSGAVQEINARYYAELAALLDRDLLFEVLLRDSPLAERLRASTVALSESEFRGVFEILRALEDGAADIDAVLSARAELQTILGPRRFSQLWAAQDPLYARLQATAERRAIDAATVDAVYQIMVEFQDSQMLAAKSGGNDPERAAGESQRLAEEERARIARLVGEGLAAEILGDRAVASFDLFSGSQP